MATTQASGFDLGNLEVGLRKKGPVGIGITNDVFEVIRRISASA